MKRGEDGWFTADIAGVKAGARYKFRIDDEIDVPDPASAFQPDDVFGPSEVIDHEAYPWRATNWRGRPWQEAVIVEAHVGTFTREGSYRAMIDRLDHLAETGITALELMPLADFAGSRNWGYDGVLWYAPDSAYGRPEDLKALIDAAHLRGLMVMLDVVYNHFGPEGNYLGRYAPSFFTEAHTPWGSAIDYRVQEVRAFAIENALSWLRDYRFDGLRLDAVNSIVEPGGLSLLHDLSAAAGKLATETGRHIHLVLENGDNRASILDAAQDPPQGKYRAQWNDDYHHAWRVLMTGEKQGYYVDYQRSPISDIARSLSSGFVYQGEPSAFRGGKRGEPSGHLAPVAFINFLQNHDQIGNRALGDRLEKLCGCASDRSGARCAAAVAVHSHAVHGRGMGLEGALPVLLRFRRRPRRCRPQGPPRRICLGLCGIWRRSAGRARSIDARFCRTRLERARRAGGTEAADAGAGPVERPPAADRPAARGRGLRRGACGRQPPADGQLANGRWRDASPARQPVEPSHQPCARRTRGNPDLGQRVGR